MEICEYCKQKKKDVKLRQPDHFVKKMLLCKNCQDKSGTEQFYYTFGSPD